MRVTAEGVATRAKALALKAMACDSLQGFYFSRPVVAELIPGLLRRGWALDDGRPARWAPVEAHTDIDTDADTDRRLKVRG